MAVFATLLFGSMLVNVVINVGRISDDLCVAQGCREARGLVPWLVAAALLLATLIGCRIFGPVFVTPAVGSWLVPGLVDRRRLLVPRLAGELGAAFLVTTLVVAATAAAAGFGTARVAFLALATGLLALAAVGLATRLQGSGDLVARALAWTLLAAIWASLVAVSVGHAPRLSAGTSTTAWIVLAVALGLATLEVVAAVRALPGLRRRDITPGGSLAPGLSGALATLDLALLYDVLLAHRWHRHDAVRARRGGPTGLWALVWNDLMRIRRTPQGPVVLAAVVVVPYAAEASGAGRVTVLLAGLVGFLALLPMLSALRLVTRTPGLTRMLPFPTSATRQATAVVPGVLGILFGLACGPALDRSLEQPLAAGMFSGVAVGLAALAAAVRWVTGRPPDYGRPLVSTPAGAVPTNLYGSIVRGFDVLLLTTAPMLLAPTTLGAEISALLSLVVLGYLTGRK